MIETIAGLGPDELRRARELREAGHFFWVDASVSPADRQALGELLGVAGRALDRMVDVDDRAPASRTVHVDGRHVAFSLTCFVADRDHEPIDVRMVIHGDFVLTLHVERISLTNLLDVQAPAGRSEQYVVHAVLDAIVATAYDALNDVEHSLQDLFTAATEMRNARLRMAELRRISAVLTEMRRRLGPQRGLLERIGEEIVRVEGLEHDTQPYFERIRDQVDRLVDSIDAAGDAMAKLIDLRLNEITYRLTVVATVFLPLTFLTGFFGMNFGWMVDRINSQSAFYALAVALPILLVVGAWVYVRVRARTDESGL
jgi:magnesium transporter